MDARFLRCAISVTVSLRVFGIAAPATHTFEGEGGTEIHWKKWRPRRLRSARGVVVIAHGGGEHSGRYQHVAERLNKEGYAVYALDHRGHGQSGGKPGLLDRMEKVVADLGSMVTTAKSENEGKPAYVLGHSTGGCIALEYALGSQEEIDGLILSAPLAKLEGAGPVQLAAARVVSRIAPATPVFKVDASTVSRDPDVVEAYDEDPLVLHKGLPARTITELDAVIKRFPGRLPELTLPLLVMVGDADKLVPPDAARMVEELAGSEDKEIIEYHGLYHEILNEPEQDQVMDDLVDWLKSH